MKQYKVGETVYFIDPWTKSCVKGLITSISKDSYSVICECYINRDGKVDEKRDRNVNIPCELLFSSYQEAYNHEDNRVNAKVASYLEEISDVNSLLQFAWNHCFDTADFTDGAARKAYELKAKELCDVDLEI